jgi:putative DNA primase/helicase
LTGGDAVDARFMRAEWFSFVPQCKIFIAANHRPGLMNVDEAICRRLQIIPFAVTIPRELRDPHLAESLEAEWPVILALMIKGCADWQRLGLAPPQVVRATTEAYLAAEDSIQAWAGDRLEPDRAAWLSSSDLFASWRDWATKAGEVPGSKKALSGKLIERGWRKQDTRVAKGFAGYRLRPSEIQA